jgi:hypothetical protein
VGGRKRSRVSYRPEIRVRDFVVGSHSESFSEYRSMGAVPPRDVAFLCCSCNTYML